MTQGRLLSWRRPCPCCTDGWTGHKGSADNPMSYVNLRPGLCKWAGSLLCSYWSFPL